jgi:hypothetical protein
LLFNLDGFGLGVVPGPDTPAIDLGPLAAYLAACYPATHPAVVVTLGSGVSVASAPLARLEELAAKLPQNSHLFLDLVRQQ